jgi:hypothetical protein
MLEKNDVAVQTPDMSNKQIVEDLLERIPEDASLHDIAREIEFIAGVRRGLDELDRGERIPIEEVEFASLMAEYGSRKFIGTKRTASASESSKSNCRF